MSKPANPFIILAWVFPYAIAYGVLNAVEYKTRTPTPFGYLLIPLLAFAVGGAAAIAHVYLTRRAQRPDAYYAEPRLGLAYWTWLSISAALGGLLFSYLHRM